jgi:hypothetical protein
MNRILPTSAHATFFRSAYTKANYFWASVGVISAIFAAVTGSYHYRKSCLCFAVMGLISLYKWNKAIPDGQKPWPGGLPKDMFLETFSHLSAQELNKMRCVCKQWNELASQPSLWQRLLEKELSSDNVINLDRYDLKSSGFPQVRRLSIHPREFLKTITIVRKASLIGTAIILTFPEGWSVDGLIKLISNEIETRKASQKPTVDLEFTKENITDFKDSLRLLEVKKEQTVVLTDLAVHDSFLKSVETQKEWLELKGLEKELPDPLTVATMLFLTCLIITERFKLPTRIFRCELHPKDKTNQKYIFILNWSFRIVIIDDVEECTGKIGFKGFRRFIKPSDS